MRSPSVLIVGASAAGLSVAESLRQMGHEGKVTMLGAETHQPYDRPPLPKQLLAGEWEAERTRLRPPQTLSALNAEWLLGEEATHLEVAERTVHTASGRRLQADHIVVATGARPRTLPGTGHLRGVHTLRTLDDAIALRTTLTAARSLVIVGDGVLAAETAATARKLGVHVTMTGPQPRPMASQLGTLASQRLAALHTENGVRLRLGTAVTGFTAQHGHVRGVRLNTGEVLTADAVVTAIGCLPNTEWLTNSGLKIDGGLVCDSLCRAAEGIHGVGDVARWHHEALAKPLRLENRTNATQQARAVAADILGAGEPYAPIPYFWTDQYDTRIQVHGTLPPDAEATVVEGDIEGNCFVALYSKADRAFGVLGWNMPKQLMTHRKELTTTFAVPPVAVR
ncbi:NAD/ferredoxin-dependent reductase-like protein [Streptomyces sp. KhCrAH-43]|uniref:NAD(P)/FAD-dependent oxidoreductase n=1 Tax=unclassified Streptomyces TaxID=2593676 RepID=UPI00037D8C39|nr:FAD-dependent oxidoreductase [Streptomyces sp. KhCrAH-43]MYS36763.1 FAD-dependent oxidoreductase [Streptomyces sp. SID4920]MYX69234.1 FAD-dependent oxidoreductase [Streptomyces sp. SID8373]RAJ62084.1 NAD/ferredoxin-dependent reductase-like protein [Streptomyces sp. KhCrAH-43]